MATQFLAKDGDKQKFFDKSLSYINREVSLSKTNINDYLPNNTNLFDKSIGYIPSFSTIQCQDMDKFLVAMFDATSGTTDAKGKLSGEWRILGQSKFV